MLWLFLHHGRCERWQGVAVPVGGLNNDHPPPTWLRRYLENSARGSTVDGFWSSLSIKQASFTKFLVSTFKPYLNISCDLFDSRSKYFLLRVLNVWEDFRGCDKSRVNNGFVDIVRSIVVRFHRWTSRLSTARFSWRGCFSFQFIDLLELNSKLSDVLERNPSELLAVRSVQRRALFSRSETDLLTDRRWSSSSDATILN